MKTGTIFILTEGEYSDYGISATLRALKDFDFDAELMDVVKAQQDADWEPGDTLRIETFRAIEALEQKGFVEHVRIPELHVGSYGQFEPGVAKRVMEIQSDVPIRRWVPADSRSDQHESLKLLVEMVIDDLVESGNGFSLDSEWVDERLVDAIEARDNPSAFLMRKLSRGPAWSGTRGYDERS